ncbi:hypothetical protein RDI58_007217 [Solanum bulbocastanum]|uniref:CBS domain-containing protein n=1 Tax=Solanum bulbocastanum TaxID=147425 RepID=A0AAN8YHH9_SOLBU
MYQRPDSIPPGLMLKAIPIILIKSKFFDDLFEELNKMTVHKGDALLLTDSNALLCVEPNDTVLDAAKKMLESQTSSAIVVVDKKPQRILISKDILIRVITQDLSPESILIERHISQSPLRHRSYEDHSHKSHSIKYDERDHYYEIRSKMNRSTVPDHRRGRSRSFGGRRDRIPVKDGSEKRTARIDQWNWEKE